MTSKKAQAVLHPRNVHQGRYNFTELCKRHPALTQFIKASPSGDSTIDFADPQAVICLNHALLAFFYNIQHWLIPPGYLCPPIPGRADYIHYVADLLAETRLTAAQKKDHSSEHQPPKGRQVRVLDIGTGSNLIYPIIGSQVYGWKFLASDIDAVAIKTAKLTVQLNSSLSKNVRVVQQKSPNHFFQGIVKDYDRFELSICNPPFHASMEEALAGSRRKWANLSKSSVNRGRKKASIQEKAPTLNFGGQNTELWCDGGERQFLSNMMDESVHFAGQICWFSSLVSKVDNILPLRKKLKALGALQVKVVEMAQGQKTSRLIAWSFLTPEEQQEWLSELTLSKEK